MTLTLSARVRCGSQPAFGPTSGVEAYSKKSSASERYHGRMMVRAVVMVFMGDERRVGGAVRRQNGGLDVKWHEYYSTKRADFL